MRIILLAACLSIVPGISASQTSKPQEAALRKALEDNLKDADSAKFRNLRFKRDDSGVVTACGEVNAKNSYGAYNGYEPFMAMGVKRGKKDEFFGASIGEHTVTMCDK